MKADVEYRNGGSNSTETSLMSMCLETAAMDALACRPEARMDAHVVTGIRHLDVWQCLKGAVEARECTGLEENHRG